MCKMQHEYRQRRCDKSCYVLLCHTPHPTTVLCSYLPKESPLPSQGASLPSKVPLPSPPDLSQTQNNYKTITGPMSLHHLVAHLQSHTVYRDILYYEYRAAHLVMKPQNTHYCRLLCLVTWYKYCSICSGRKCQGMYLSCTYEKYMTLSLLLPPHWS